MAPPKSQLIRLTLVDWEEAGERWELPKRGVYPIWQMIHPNVMLEIQATPIGEMFPKIQLAMASKSDKYDIIDHDYSFFPQLIDAGHLTQVQDYLDVDEAYKDGHIQRHPREHPGSLSRQAAGGGRRHCMVCRLTATAS